MADSHNPDEQFDERRLHNDFRHYHHLSGLQDWAINSETEQQRLTRDIDIITTRWQNAPSPWKDHWDHLVAATKRWEQNPERMQRLLDRIACDYERTGITELASPVEVRNLLLAGELLERRRTDLGFGNGHSGPDRIDFPYGYLTSYRAAGAATRWKSLPSWSTARRWLIDQTTATAPDTGVDITITGPDPRSGAAARPLMTGTGLSARELGDQLRHLDELLGTTQIPVDPSPQPWLDDLRYDLLCDAYRDTLIDQANPWAVGRRFEHYLRADDLHTHIVDYADRAALSRAEGSPNTEEEQPDIVESRLDEIRQDVRQSDIDWTTPPRAITWLDEAVDEAEQRFDTFIRDGLTLCYANPEQPGHLTTIGFDDDHWYVQHGQVGQDGRTIVYDTPAKSYRSCDELLSGTATSVVDLAPVPPSRVAIPDMIASELRAFERDWASLKHGIATVRELRDAIRTGRPYILRGPQSSNGKTPSRTASVISREANRIAQADTSGSEQPAPPTQSTKQSRAKRRQPPKSVGRQHRRRL
ncbi:hypothetical protein NS506_02658 [Nocardia seriolae]|uniref:Uncharacterized protein n=1 Tax=Nocardia seriolae TaxID=37332 RepID=A0ABC8AR96_9NOCA|nr:hypothetical protein [Nocardia seriolae]APA96720.1 hypothetical protein NS506_02658 [Nocardia seriolae]